MCGRFSLTAPEEDVRKAFGHGGAPRNLRPRWNVAPTQESPVLRREAEGGLRLDLLAWGLVPYWAEDPSVGSRMINARGETVAEKPAYRQAYRQRRCLVPADGFYEWEEKGDKRPILFRASDAAPFAFAGLWEKWVPKSGGVLETFTIVNCAAQPGSLMARYHHRTPVILAPEDYDAWLDTERDPQALIRPPREGFLSATRVSTYVNKVANDDSNCFVPAPDEPPPAAELEAAPKKRAKLLDDRQGSLF
jgi:putative SOS response-associated peptidase YedK